MDRDGGLQSFVLDNQIDTTFKALMQTLSELAVSFFKG